MASFDDDTDALGLDGLLNCLRELRGEALLHLQAAGKDLYEAR